MKRTLLTISLFFLKFACLAQVGPVYGQYFHNPFLYNPGFAGAEMYPVLSLTHQRQLMGVADAPVAYTLVFHTPIHKNIAVGAKIYSESQGLLRSSSGQIALVYALPLNEQTNLRFGLAGGLTNNQLDLSSASEAQLTYLAGLSNHFNQIDLRFGMVFNSPKLKAGLSFPNMTKRSLVSYSSFEQLELDPLEHLVLTGTYKLDLVPTRLLLEPVLIYERFNSSGEQRMEGGALLYLKELVWIGGTYQHKHGFSGLLGLKIKDNLSFGYAYGMSQQVTNLYRNASHEVQLKIKLGKLRNYKKEEARKPRFEL
jgi:type IX secretion system PorP/SprF family membrane protein